MSPKLISPEHQDVTIFATDFYRYIIKIRLDLTVVDLWCNVTNGLLNRREETQRHAHVGTMQRPRQRHNTTKPGGGRDRVQPGCKRWVWPCDVTTQDSRTVTEGTFFFCFDWPALWCFVNCTVNLESCCDFQSQGQGLVPKQTNKQNNMLCELM